MPAVALVADIVLGPLITDIVGGVLGAEVAGTAILGSVTVGSLVSGEIIGAGVGAATAAIQGGDIAKGALGGFVGATVAPLVSAGVSGLLGGTSYGGYSGIPATGTSPILGNAITSGLSKGLGSLAGGVAGGMASGAPFQSALRSGLISGASSGLATGVGTGFGLGGTSTSALQSALQYGLNQAFPAQQPSFKAPSFPVSSRPSPTLGQSLSIAPSLGYSPTGTVFGSGDSEKPKSNVWNVGSLRNVGASDQGA